MKKVSINTGFRELVEGVRGYQAFVLDDDSRSKLLREIPPKYSDVIAHHVTHKFGVDSTHEMPGDATAEVVGHADDGKGVQALVVKINGSTTRPDGGTYHLTHSIDRAAGRKPVHSNDVVKQGYTPLDKPVKINVSPKFIKG